MWVYYLAIVLTIVSNIFYHVFQKSTPANVNPIFSLMITYITSAVVCMLILPFYPGWEGLSESFKRLSWVSLGLGVAIVGLEFGFLLAYRAGWNISLAGIVSNFAVGLMLIPVGLVIFHEKLTIPNIIGIGLCFGGLVLINLK